MKFKRVLITDATQPFGSHNMHNVFDASLAADHQAGFGLHRPLVPWRVRAMCTMCYKSGVRRILLTTLMLGMLFRVYLQSSDVQGSTMFVYRCAPYPWF